MQGHYWGGGPPAFYTLVKVMSSCLLLEHKINLTFYNLKLGDKHLNCFEIQFSFN